MKKANYTILILTLSFCMGLLFFHQKSEKQILLNHEAYSYTKLQNENTRLVRELNDQRYVSLLLFNYSDYKAVKKDTTLIKLMLNIDTQ